MFLECFELLTSVGNFQPFVSFNIKSLCNSESSSPDDQVALHGQVQDSFRSDFALRSQISFPSDENHLFLLEWRPRLLVIVTSMLVLLSSSNIHSGFSAVSVV